MVQNLSFGKRDMEKPTKETKEMPEKWEGNQWNVVFQRPRVQCFKEIDQILLITW